MVSSGLLSAGGRPVAVAPPRDRSRRPLSIERAFEIARGQGYLRSPAPGLLVGEEEGSPRDPVRARPDPRLRSGGPVFGDVLRGVQSEIRELPLAPEQARTLGHASSCRTPALGGGLEVCPGCGFVQAVYRSCGDRCCPQCGSLAGRRWLERTTERILPVRCYHLVVTLLPELRALARSSPRAVYGLFSSAVARSVSALVCEKLGRVQPGLTVVLHTWNRWGGFHPHQHAIVAAGGLSEDEGAWVEAPSGQCLLPCDRLRALFERRFFAGLLRLSGQGRLRSPDDPAPLGPRALAASLERLRPTHVYAKRTLEGAEDAFRYLAAYATRPGFSNARLLEHDPVRKRVVFETKRREKVELSSVDFVLRWLQHALPLGLHRVRHYGLYAARRSAALALARAALLGEEPSAGVGKPAPASPPAPPGREPAEGCSEPPTPEPPTPSPEAGTASTVVAVSPAPARPRETFHELYLRLTGVDLTRCPHCGEKLLVQPLPPRRPAAARAPP